MSTEKFFKGIAYPIPEHILQGCHSNMPQDYYEREYYLTVLLKHDEPGRKYFAKFEGKADSNDYLCWTEIYKSLFDEIIDAWDKGRAVFIQYKNDLTETERENIYLLENEEVIFSGIDVDELSREVPQFPAVMDRAKVPFIYCDMTEPVRIPVRH